MLPKSKVWIDRNCNSVNGLKGLGRNTAQAYNMSNTSEIKTQHLRMPPRDMPATASSKAGITWTFKAHERSLFRVSDADSRK